MSRMSDIMEMVKQGYSVKEIKEVFERGKEIESEPAEKAEENSKEENPILIRSRIRQRIQRDPIRSRITKPSMKNS